MKSRLLIIASVWLALPATSNLFAGGMPLYDNGPLVTANEVDICDFSGTIGTSFPSGLNFTLGIQSRIQNKRQIDDFFVPPGESWTLTSLRWRCYQPGTFYDFEITDARVRVWNTPPASGGTPLWGDLTTNRRINSIFSGIFRTPSSLDIDCSRAIKDVDVSLDGLPPLPPGQYWIEIAFDNAHPAAIFSPPTEPRLPGDNAMQTDYSEVVTNVLDANSGLPLEYPFQLFGTAGPEVERACVRPDGTCVNATLLDCEEVFGGVYKFHNTCAQLGACCNHATGACVANTAPLDCTGSGRQFSVGVSCASVPNCGLLNGACCFPNATPTTCQSFTRGINCHNMGGHWHPGNCVSVSCNDFCETATPIFNGDTGVDNFGAGIEHPATPNACNHDPFIGTKDVWFRYHATLSNPGGAISFSMCHNTTFRSTLQVYLTNANTTCEDLNGSAADFFCDVDGCGPGGPATLTVPADPGDVFLIRIGGYAGAEGGGILRITPIENGVGACCMLEGVCEIMSEAECLAGPNHFTPQTTCELATDLCGPIGACCRGTEGCQITYAGLCDAQGGLYRGEGSVCGSPVDCDGDGETDECAFAGGATDCNENGIPDSCDIGVAAISTDCDGNAVPDECQQPLICCPGDVNGDTRIDGLDIEPFVLMLLDEAPICFTRPFCRADMNEDHRLDTADAALFAQALVSGAECPILLHSSARVDEFDPNNPFTRRVFLLNAAGDVIGSYDAVPEAQSDAFGYRDGATDGAYVYFGWTNGVARHDADGSNGVQIISGPTPGTGATWRALAYDPTGDEGRGSFWTQSFISDLIEVTLDGQLLNQFPNDLNLYGLAYDHETGMLWGHSIDTENAAIIVEIDPATGQPTGTAFPSHFNVPGPSNQGVALHAGLEMDPQTGILFGALQGTSDAVFSVLRNGELSGPLMPNPRADLSGQTGSIAHLGITISRP